MSSEASKIFVGVVVVIVLYMRWASDSKFPLDKVILALAIIGIGLAFTYGAVDVGKLAPNLAKFWQIASQP